MSKQNKKPFIDTRLLKRVLYLVQPFKKQFYWAALLSVVLAVLAPLKPYLIQEAVDNQILTFNYIGLRNITIILLALLFFEAAMRYNFMFTARWLGQSIIKQLRLKVFNHMVRFKLRYYDKTAVGTATTRTITDVERVNDIFSQGLLTIIADLLMLIGVLVVMLIINWRLTLVCLIPFPLIIWFTYIFKEKMKSAFRVVREQVSRLNAFLQEHITGMKIEQIFSAEQQAYQLFKSINNEHKKANIRTILYFSVFLPLLEITLSISLGLLVWFGAKGVVTGIPKTEIGHLVVFPWMLNMLFRPMRMLADRFNTLQMGMVASERVFDVLDKAEVIEDKGNIKEASIKGEVAFKNVWFAYDEVNYVLKDVSFQLKQGETLAIVGATGSGKTSIINVLNRFYEIQKGEVLIDGVNAKDYQLTALRSGIGMVLQDVFLFSGSILDNITLRNNSITKEQVIEASKIVGAHDFIMKLPGNYGYDVMERGATLSLGQRQIISFIRALVYNPKILILDEATSSIDTESELLIQQAIEKLIKGRTSIVIAHRLSTIQQADKILVLDSGEIKEQGSHNELLALGGIYKKLNDMQFKQPAVA